MDFDAYKDSVLDKLYGPDLSRKGSVDDFIRDLIDMINRHKDYVTTSSCSGRILLHVPAAKKYDAIWLFVTHEATLSFEMISPLLTTLPKDAVYFKTEGFILHVACRDFAAAKRFMIFAQQHGYKNTGIIAASTKFIVQIQDTKRFDTLLADKGELLVSEKYVELLVQKGNTLLQSIHKGVEGFREAWKTFR